jgi:hypothetical protein
MLAYLDACACEHGLPRLAGSMDKLTRLTIGLLKLALANPPQGSRLHQPNPRTAISEEN